VARIKRGETAAGEALVHAYERGLRSVLRRCGLKPWDADDILQDVWMIALAKIGRDELREPAQLNAFVRSIALNCVANYRRKNARHATSNDTAMVEATPADVDTPEQQLQRAADRTLVWEVLEELSRARDRAILELFVLRGRDKDEVCCLLGIDAARFHGVLCRAKKRYLKLFETRMKLRDGPP
jgi:RNA polymerase sigma factor (sigma-70 family)